MRTTVFIVAALTGLGAFIMGKNKKNRHQVRLTKPVMPAPLPPGVAPSQQPVTTAEQQLKSGSVLSYYPKADVLLSAGPRKSQKDTELGEDVAGVALTHDRVVFWVLDGTSDSASILNEKGAEILSSRLLALTLGATLHQLAPLHHTADTLLAAAFAGVENQIQEQIVQQRQNLEQFVATQHPDLHHWQVSTTVLLGLLSADGTADLLRIGDSKAFCYNEGFDLINTAVGDKPNEIGLGRLYARLTHYPANTETPFSFALMLPARSEQMHTVQETGVRRIIAFSDGIGHPTEQYLRLMLGRQAYSHFQVGLARTPNRTFDDKTIVLVSFEPSQKV